MKNKQNVTSGFEFKLVSEQTIGISSFLDKAINFISRFVVTLVLSIGAIFTFTSMMKLDVDGGVLLLVLAISAIVSTIGYNSKFKNLHVFLASLALVVIGALVAFEYTKSGVKVISESVTKSIYEAMYWTVPDLSIKHAHLYAQEATYVLSLVSILLNAAVGFFVTAKINFIGTFLLTFPFFEIGAAFGCVAEKMPFAFLLAGWGASLVLHISLRQRNITKHKNSESKKKSKQKSFTYADTTKRFGASALVMVVSLLLVFSLVNSLLISAGFSRSAKLDKFRADFKETVLNAYDLITGFDHDASLKEGNLAVLADRKIKDRNYAVLETDNMEDDLYLKGYTGGIYTGDAWKEIEDDEYEFIDEFRTYLTEKGIALPTLSGDAIDSDINGNDLRPSKIRLYDFRRQKDYMYLANATVSSVGTQSKYDKYLVAKDKADYEYNAYCSSNAPFVVATTSRFDTFSFKKYWRTYVDFVNYEYLMLPEEGLDEIKRLGEILVGQNIYQSVDNVRAYVAETTEYSDFVAKLPDGKDFASYFVFEKRMGYSAHYATATAVILRSMGIPTRYVEGFYVPNEQVLKGENMGGARKVQLTDANSHAWIEVFVQECGWIPVEVTEGFYTQTLESQFNDFQNQNEEELEQNEEQLETPQEEIGYEEEVLEESEPTVEEDENATEEDGHKYVKNKIVEPLTIAFLIALLVVVLIVLAFGTVRRAVLIRRNRIFGSDDYKRQIEEGFKLLKKILKFMEVNLSEVYSYDQLAKIISQSFDHIEVQKAKQMISIYEKTQFSREVPKKQDVDEFLDFVDDLGDLVYKKLVVKHRLKFKFIDLI